MYSRTMAVKKNLFTNDLGDPLAFHTEDCGFQGTVTYIIRNNGGRVMQNSSGPHTVSLAGSRRTRYNRSVSSYKGGSTFSYTYITDCIRNRKLLPLKNYWVNKDPDFDDRFDPNDVMLGAFTWASCKLPKQNRQPSHPHRQPSHPQPSSSSGKRNGEEDPQDISLHLPTSPFPDRIRKCVVRLERIKLPHKSKRADAANTSEDPHQGASTSCDSDDDRNFFDWTISWCGESSQFGDKWLSQSRRQHGGFSAKVKGARQPRVQEREEVSDSALPVQSHVSSPTKAPQPLPSVGQGRENVKFCLSPHELEEVEVKEEEEDLVFNTPVLSPLPLEQSHNELAEDPLAILPEQEPVVAEVEEQREAGGSSGGEVVDDDPLFTDHPEASAFSDSEGDCTPSGLDLIDSAMEQYIEEQSVAICEAVLSPNPLPVHAEEDGRSERDVSNGKTTADASLARPTEHMQEEVEESLPPLTTTSCSPHTRPMEQMQEDVEEPLPPLTTTSCSPHTRPMEHMQEEVEESLPPLTTTSCSPHTRPTEQMEEDVEESLPPLTTTSCSPHTRPTEQMQEEVEESLPRLTTTSCSPHTRLTEQMQEEAEESVTSPHHQSEGRPTEHMQEVEDCRSSLDHQDMEDSGSEATTIIFSMQQSPKESDSCPSRKKLKRRSRGRKAQLARRNQQNGRVSTLSDSSSSILDQDRPKMNPRPRKQLRRKRGSHPGGKEDEEEEEEDETEPIVRKVSSKHPWINKNFPRVQLARLPQNYRAELSSDSTTSSIPRQCLLKKMKPELRRLRRRKRVIDEEQDEDEGGPTGEQSSPAPPEDQGEQNSPSPPEDQGPPVVGPERNPSPQEEVGPSSTQQESGESRFFNKCEERRVYPPKRRTRGSVAAARLSNGVSLASPERQSKQATTGTSSMDSDGCPLFSSPVRVIAERKGEYHVDEDMDILEYIAKYKAYDRLGGRAFWREMEQSFGYRRTWQSLKERFRKRIVTNLKAYISHGLDPSVIKELEGKITIKKGTKRRAQRHEFSHDEDLLIIKFIIKNRRYCSVAGLMLWQEMESECPELANHTWSSLKTRFMKKILPNIDRYNLSRDEVLQFKNRRKLTEEKKRMENQKKLPTYRKQRLTRLKPRSNSSMTSTSHTEEEDEDSTDLSVANSSLKRKHLPARSRRATMKKSSPSESDTHTSSTTPSRKRQLLMNDVVMMTPRTPFTSDTINRSLMRRRKKRLGNTGKGRQKVKGTVAGGGSEEGDSSQDTPRVRKRIVVVAEVHNERMEEESDEDREGTSNSEENALPSSAPLEEEKEKEEEDKTRKNKEDENGEEKKLGRQNIELAEEVIEETEEATTQERQGMVNGNWPQEEETSEDEVSSGEAELEVYIHPNTPGTEGEEMEGEEDARQQTPGQKQAPDKSNKLTGGKAGTVTNEEMDDSLPDLNFTGERESSEDGQGGEKETRQRSCSLQSPPKSPRPLPALHVITSRMSVQSPGKAKPTTTGHPIFTTSLRKHLSTPPSPVPPLSPSPCGVPPNDCPSPCTLTEISCPAPRVTPSIVQQRAPETVVRVRHFRRSRSHAHIPKVVRPTVHVNAATQLLPLANPRGTPPAWQNLPGAVQHKGTLVILASPGTASPPAQQSLPSTMPPRGPLVTGGSPVVACSPVQQSPSGTVQHKGTPVTIGSPVAASLTLLLSNPTALPTSIHSNPTALPTSIHSNPTALPTSIHSNPSALQSTSPLVHNLQPLPVVIRNGSTPLLVLPNPDPLAIRHVVPVLQGSLDGTLPTLQLNPSPQQHGETSSTLQNTPITSVELCTPPALHNSPTTLQPSQPRRLETLGRILQPSSDTSDSLVDIMSLPSRALDTPEPRARLPEDVDPPSASTTLSNRLRKQSIRM